MDGESFRARPEDRYGPLLAVGRIEPLRERPEAEHVAEPADAEDTNDPEWADAPQVVTVHSAGGGWYEIRLGETVLDRIRGKEAAEQRAAELGMPLED